MGDAVDDNARRGASMPEWPPLGFVPYGLDEEWQGTRQLVVFDGPPGKPSTAVWFGHRAEGSPGYLVVGTGPRTRFARHVARNGNGRQEKEAARSAAHWLLNLSLPHISVPRPPGWSTLLTNHVHAQAEEFMAWPTTVWYIDDEAAEARVWQFAHGWAGYTAAHDEHFLMLAGVDVEVDGWRLVPTPDTGAYGFDLHKPLGPDLLNDILAARGGPEHAFPTPRTGWHPDHLDVLERN